MTGLLFFFSPSENQSFPDLTTRSEPPPTTASAALVWGLEIGRGGEHNLSLAKPG